MSDNPQKQVLIAISTKLNFEEAEALENWDLKKEIDRLSQSIYGLTMEIEQLRSDLAKNKAHNKGNPKCGLDS